MAEALTAHALTTVQRFKAAVGIPDADENLCIRVINSASDEIERIADRHFERETLTESVAGYGTSRLVVSRLPVVTVTGITFDGSAMDITDLDIDLEAGLLQLPGGFVWTAHTVGDISNSPMAGSERRQFVVSYTGGYVLPKDDGAPARDLPYDLEDAVTDIARTMYFSAKRDPTITREKLLSYSVAYGGETSQRATATALAYKRLLP